MAIHSRPLSILTYSNLFPNEVQPTHGIFVARRLEKLIESGQVAAAVVAPVPWFPFKAQAFGRYADHARVPATEMRAGVSVTHPRFLALPLVGSSLNPIAMAAATLQRVRAIDRARPFDLLDAHYLYPDGVAAAIIAQLMNKPLVITARGSDINLLPQYRVPRLWIQWAIRVADKLIGVSEALSRKLIVLGAHQSKVVTLRNGVDQSDFCPADYAMAREALSWKGTMLLSVGNLVESKGHHVVIEALSRLENAELVIVGDGPYRGRLQEAAERFGVTNRVRFAGSLGRAALVTHYSAADVLVLASSMEGMPNVVLEAMSCGLPVVATDCGGIAEVLTRPEQGVLIQSRNADMVRIGIQKVLGNYPDRAAVRRSAEGFDWNDTIRRQLALYSEVVDATAARKRSIR